MCARNEFGTKVDRKKDVETQPAPAHTVTSVSQTRGNLIPTNLGTIGDSMMRWMGFISPHQNDPVHHGAFFPQYQYYSKRKRASASASSFTG